MASSGVVTVVDMNVSESTCFVKKVSTYNFFKKDVMRKCTDYNCAGLGDVVFGS